MIVAKPVIPDQYWILRQDDRKVGNIQAEPGGFSVKINNQVRKFKSITTIKKTVDISFEAAKQTKKTNQIKEIYGYPTTHRPYNAIYDVRHQVPLWTRDPRSKSWLAAGWYRVKQGRRWEVVECPKLILLERYPYQGPFRTEQEAQDR